jgi:hypothetical protein
MDDIGPVHYVYAIGKFCINLLLCGILIARFVVVINLIGGFVLPYHQNLLF